MLASHLSGQTTKLILIQVSKQVLGLPCMLYNAWPHSKELCEEPLFSRGSNEFRAALTMVFTLNHRGVLKKILDVIVKGPKAYNDRDYKTVSAVRAQLQNTMECADVVCHLQNHLCLFKCVLGMGGKGGCILEAISTTFEMFL